MRRRVMCILFVLAFVFAMCENVFAFQAVGHHVIIKKAAESLPEGSRIKKAILDNLDIASWGANGPDFGYIDPKKILGDYAKWGDLFHYEKIGSQSREMLKEALKSGDDKKIAFAAGWLSHQIGDMEGHNIFVNVEGGAAIGHPEFDEIHGLLEKSAEPYIWEKIGGYDIADYNTSGLSQKYSNVGSIPYDVLDSATRKVHGKSIDKLFLKRCVYTYKAGLATGIGYTYTDSEKAMAVLSKNNRSERLETAVENAVRWTAELLWEAENGNYEGFKDRWNLDVGRSENPIGTITVKVKTQDVMFAGTDHDIYFGMIDRWGNKYEKYLDNGLYNDFERGDEDNYYMYFDNFNILPSDIKSIYLRKEDNGKPGGDWDLGGVTLYLNGKAVVDETINKEINDKYHTWSKNVNISNSNIDINPDKLPWEN